MTQKQTLLKVTLYLFNPFFTIHMSLLHTSSLYNPKPLDLWLLGAAQQVFMPESDASNFFKRRSRRSPRYYAELQGASFSSCLMRLLR